MLENKLQAAVRENVGSNKVNKLRAEKIIPAVIYSRDEESMNVQIKESTFLHVYRIAGNTSIIGLKVGEEEIPVIIKDVQSHPYKNQIMHIDFQKVSMDEKVRLTIPVILLNRENIKAQPSVLNQQIDELEIECLPMDIPNAIEYDVIDLNFDDTITVGDLDIAKDEKVTIHRDLDEVVCSLNHFVEEDLDEEVGEASEPELIGAEDSDDQDEEDEE